MKRGKPRKKCPHGRGRERTLAFAGPMVRCRCCGNWFGHFFPEGKVPRRYPPCSGGSHEA